MKLRLLVKVEDEPEPSAKEWDELHLAPTEHVRDIFATMFETRPEFAEGLPNPNKMHYRLFTHVVPIDLAAGGDTRIASTGALKTNQIILYAELSTLLAVVWIEGMLPERIGAMGGDEMRRDTAVGNASMRSRVRLPL